MSAFDFVAQFAKVLGSNINPRTRAVQLDLGGIGSLDLGENADDEGEVSEQSPMFDALGFVSRPLGPEIIKGKEYAAESLCMRTADGLVPFSYRDLRLNAYFPQGVPRGRIAMVGYGGGFHSIDLTDDNNGDQKSSIHFIYAPYDYANGEPRKAMAIALDTTPGQENISLSIGGGSNGFQISMTEADGLQVRTPDDSTYFNIREDEINMAANKIMLKGNVYVGSQAEAGIPLLPGPASPASPSLFVSPV